MFLFLTSIYPFGDATAKTSLKTNQAIYWYGWWIFASAHIIVFMPFVTIWGLIDN